MNYPNLILSKIMIQRKLDYCLLWFQVRVLYNCSQKNSFVFMTRLCFSTCVLRLKLALTHRQIDKLKNHTAMNQYSKYLSRLIGFFSFSIGQSVLRKRIKWLMEGKLSNTVFIIFKFTIFLHNTEKAKARLNIRWA